MKFIRPVESIKFVVSLKETMDFFKYRCIVYCCIGMNSYIIRIKLLRWLLWTAKFIMQIIIT